MICEELKLKTLYDNFFLKNQQPKSDEPCKIFETKEKKKEKEKNICLNLVRHLEKIGEITENSKRNDHCNYLTYWFYDELADTLKDNLKKKEDIAFFNELIGVVNKVKLPQSRYPKCTLKYESGVSLDEWKKRKLSYIYMKNYDDIKSKIFSQKKEQCDKYTTYIDNINKLYINYKTNKCGWLMSSKDYADCSGKYDPKPLITELAKCKTQGSNGSQSSLLSWFLGSPSPKTAPNKGSPGVQEPSRTAVSKSPGGIASPGGKPTGTEGADYIICTYNSKIIICLTIHNKKNFIKSCLKQLHIFVWDKLDINSNVIMNNVKKMVFIILYWINFHHFRYNNLSFSLLNNYWLYVYKN
ncbi:hypothetical protein PVNG_06397 [Plasmodium vivax North Korean]|uniref:Variable surface protein Vir12 n=1 Tax=Plasmodium vivax North Korean TaxID=1035514 RepID=A0A0J9WF28_PLAVI|nr:hypothetical protein PVNG_06397 [Plasmodium vivax North Korean]